MSVSSISGIDTSAAQAALKQRMEDFKALGQALQSGDLKGAQSAFQALENDIQQSQAAMQSSSAAGQNNPIAQDMNTIQQALQSGNLDAAKQAFQDLQQRLAAHHGHHHHHHAAAATSGTADNDAGTSISQLLQSLGNALNSGNTSAAQQAFTNLQNTLQQAAPAGSTGASPWAGGTGQTGSVLNVLA
jgi:hypothetical protein